MPTEPEPCFPSTNGSGKRRHLKNYYMRYLRISAAIKGSISLSLKMTAGLFLPVLVHIVNLTHAACPYTLIKCNNGKNIIAAAVPLVCLNKSAALAKENGCYNLMLMTGAKRVRCVFTGVRALTEMIKPRLSGGSIRK